MLKRWGMIFLTLIGLGLFIACSDDDSTTTEPPFGEITILTPTASDTLRVGETTTITWEDDISENIKIDLYEVALPYFHIATISESTDSDGSFDWNIPADLAVGDRYYVKITSVNNENIYDDSDNFTIPLITITEPNASTVLQANETVNITWEDNIDEPVKIEVLKGDNFNIVIADSATSDGTYKWDILDNFVSSDEYQIKITSTVDPELSTLSEKFIIKNDGITWSKSFGGDWFDSFGDIVIDNSGNKYVVGSFFNTCDFEAVTLVSQGISDVYIVKYDANDNVLWAESFGGITEDFATFATTDDDGNLYVVGNFEETATFGTHTFVSNGSRDVFVLKMSSEGELLWAQSYGGASYDFVSGVAVDSSGNIYINGTFGQVGPAISNIAIFGEFRLTSNGEQDGFLVKLDNNGTPVWAESFGSSQMDNCREIVIDNSDNIYAVGYFQETVEFGSHSKTSKGLEDIFLAKLNTDGDFIWVTRAGGTSEDKGYSVNVDNNGHVYITGYFDNTAHFGSATFNTVLFTTFVSKLDDNGNFIWTNHTVSDGTTIGVNHGNGIACDEYGNVFITGYYHQNIDIGSTHFNAMDETDFFIARLDSDGNFNFAERAGTENSIVPVEKSSLAIDSDNSVYVCGNFEGEMKFDDLELPNNGFKDVFIVKYVFDDNLK